jgi:hypothetical protein
VPGTDGQPQPWDLARVQDAYHAAQELVEALAADTSGDEYRRAIEVRRDEMFANVESEQQRMDQVAHLIYGATLFGLGAVTVAETASGIPRASILAQTRQVVEAWLGGASW